MAYFGFSSRKPGSLRLIFFFRSELICLGFISFLSTIVSTNPVSAAELVMFEDPGCGWCQKWNREIGATYRDTDIGRAVPLRRTLKNGARPGDLKTIENIRYTPTFVVVHGGREIGRIVGYPSEDFFWGYLEEIIARIGVGMNNRDFTLNEREN